jgi:hypothetical protein
MIQKAENDSKGLKSLKRPKMAQKGLKWFKKAKNDSERP